MHNSKMGEPRKEKEWNENLNEKINQEAIQRVADFMQEDDEVFFWRTIQGLSLTEIEEFLEECPEFRIFWNKENGNKEN